MSAIDSKRIKNLPGARKAALPPFISPQLATLVASAPAGAEWLHELKFDGYRMVCHLHRGKARFWSRNQKDWTEKFPNLSKALKALPVTAAILDGEVVVVDKAGRSSFQKLQQSMKGGAATFVFQIFDLIYLDGYNLTRVPLRERKALLEDLLAGVDAKGPLRYSDHVVGNGDRFFKQACAYGIEGIVSKLADSVYESTRTRSWLKVKCTKRQEFVIAGYTPSKKNFPGFGSLILGVYDKGKLVYSGRVGTGFSIKLRLELQKKLDQIAQPVMPFATKPKDPGLRDAHWAKPQLVGEVEFTEWTEEGSIRHPSFQGLREDKKATEVVREERV
ncbi:MAG: bifunctional non-ous end joining protein LigD [Pyrinomonadaceae bacterium]|jgi:bifunctional non-homologous end joining protein LigD|nr:bifunctional non-ous end joining protein LigD [Pyrinomonadaceae bacterium]